MRPRSAALAAVIAAAALALAACTGDGGASTTSPTASDSPREQQADSSILPEQAAAKLPAMRVADGVVPPTNRWYSSLAFGDEALPVFPRPLSFTPAADGFAFSLPLVTASTETIFGSAAADVRVTLAGAEALPTVVAATDAYVTAAWGGAPGAARVTLAQGWPVVALTAPDAVEATLSVAFSPSKDGVAVARVGDVEYGVKVDGGDVDGTRLTLGAGGSAQFFAVPTGGSAAGFAAALGEPVTEVTANWSLGADAATTTVTYSDSPTVIAVPAERDVDADCSLGTFATVDGPYKACAASGVTWSDPLVTPSASLDLGGITGAQRAAITAALIADAAAPAQLPGDTYFGTKALYRLANLLQLADALGETATADALAGTLDEQLELWGDPKGCEARSEKCFVYDATAKAVMGLAPAFGSDELNDHHFHYGYLLYAAAVAGARDPALAARIGPVMDLVAADIAWPGGGDEFPTRRVFDPVAGHSWASGSAPFADGNNQESSSEAAAAWNGVALWATVRGNAALADEATWMLSAESAAANRLWLTPDLAPFPGFAHRIVSLEWGGKRDYATWFSPDANAKLGIQLIPLAPAMAGSLAANGPAIAPAVADAVPGAAYDRQFGDYLLMYLALDPSQASAAWKGATAIDASHIDDANSRAYVLAWIAAAGA